MDPGAQEAPTATTVKGSQAGPGGWLGGRGRGGRRGRGPGLPAGTPGPAPPWAWGKDRRQQEGKEGPSPTSGRTRSLAQGQQHSTGQTHVQRRERAAQEGLGDGQARAQAMRLPLGKSVRRVQRGCGGQGPQPDFALCASYTSIEPLLSCPRSFYEKDKGERLPRKSS